MSRRHWRAARGVSRAFYAVARAVCVGFCRVWFRMTVEGLEHVPRSGAFVLAPVHRSNMDTPIVSVVTRRRLRYMGKDSLWKRAFPRWFLSALGGFPVTRGSADKEALVRCIAVLKNGEPLVLFPEGERKSGAAGPAAVRRRGVRGCEGRRAHRPRGHRWVRAGDAEGLQADPPAQGPRRHRRTHHRPGRGPGTGAARAALADVTQALHDRLQELFDRAQVRAGV